MTVWPPVDMCSCLGAVRNVSVYREVNRDVDIAVTATAIGFAGETFVLDSDAVLTLGIQLAAQQLGFQCLDEGREGGFQLVDSLLLPFAYQ